MRVFYSGNIDISELPSAYKNAESVVSDMQEYSLADVVDRVMPYGSIMACDWQRGVSWKEMWANKRNTRKEATRQERRNAKQELVPFDDRESGFDHCLYWQWFSWIVDPAKALSTFGYRVYWLLDEKESSHRYFIREPLINWARSFWQACFFENEASICNEWLFRW